MNTPSIITRIVEDDQYFVTNNTDEAFTLGWNSRQYQFDPGVKALVPFGLIANWFGDPRATPGQRITFGKGKAISVIAKREDEITRILTLWGDISNGNASAVPKFVPDVLVQFSNGDKIETIRDDPEGKGVAVSVTNVSESEKMREELDALRSTVANLEDALNAKQANVKKINPNGVVNA